MKQTDAPSAAFALLFLISIAGIGFLILALLKG